MTSFTASNAVHGHVGQGKLGPEQSGAGERQFPFGLGVWQRAS
jgi:hypothetical protein